LALNWGNVDNFVDDFIIKLNNDLVRNQLIMMTYAAGTRKLACVASQADTITQNMQLHGISGKLGSSSEGQGAPSKGKNSPTRNFYKGKQNDYSNKVSSVDGKKGGSDDNEEETPEDRLDEYMNEFKCNKTEATTMFKELRA
jgi:hypothetical protein